MSIELLNQLVELCREWLVVVKDDHAGGWQEYACDYVHCYFALRSDHKAVRIGGFEIGFHSSPKLECKVSDWPNLETTIAKGLVLLEQERERRGSRTESERIAVKEALKQALLKQLQDLEAI